MAGSRNSKCAGTRSSTRSTAGKPKKRIARKTRSRTGAKRRPQGKCSKKTKRTATFQDRHHLETLDYEKKRAPHTDTDSTAMNSSSLATDGGDRSAANDPVPCQDRHRLETLEYEKKCAPRTDTGSTGDASFATATTVPVDEYEKSSNSDFDFGASINNDFADDGFDSHSSNYNFSSHEGPSISASTAPSAFNSDTPYEIRNAGSNTGKEEMLAAVARTNFQDPVALFQLSGMLQGFAISGLNNKMEQNQVNPEEQGELIRCVRSDVAIMRSNFL